MLEVSKAIPTLLQRFSFSVVHPTNDQLRFKGNIPVQPEGFVYEIRAR